MKKAENFVFENCKFFGSRRMQYAIFIYSDRLIPRWWKRIEHFLERFKGGLQ